MRNLLQLLSIIVAAVLFFSGCDKSVENSSPIVKTSFLLNFTDTKGDNLLSDIEIKHIDRHTIDKYENANVLSPVDNKLEGLLIYGNNNMTLETEYVIVGEDESLRYVYFDCLYEYNPYSEAVCEYKFTSPHIFGDNEEHLLVFNILIKGWSTELIDCFIDGRKGKMISEGELDGRMTHRILFTIDRYKL